MRTQQSTGEPLLRLQEVSKVYPGVRALDGVSIDFAPNEIHGLVGQNGAGKSTLIQLVAGAIQPDQGQIEFGGVSSPYSTPHQAQKAGISVVYQEFQSLPALSVAENILVESRFGDGPFMRWGEARRAATAALEAVGVSLDVRATMDTLTPAQRKLVEIARAIWANARLLVLDEPTAALEAADTRSVLDAMVRAREAGHGVVFVSHRLNEVISVCDRVTVLRDGKVAGCWPTAELTADLLADRMVGGSMSSVLPERAAPREASVLSAKKLVVDRAIRDVSFEIREGEILGVAGVIGSGRSELGKALFGILPMEHGEVAVEGRQLRLGSPSDAVAAGVAYVPADRQTDGLVFTFDIQRNLSLVALDRVSRRGRIHRSTERDLAERLFDRMGVVATGLDQDPDTLSGGNQQKVLLGRWLAVTPRLLILDEPTQGVDIAAQAEIHKLIVELAEQGLAVLLMSSDSAELIAMSDRILVMRGGEIAETLSRGEATEESLVLSTEGAVAQ